MAEQGIEALATEVAQELSLPLKNFRIDKVDSNKEGMTIHCSWTAPYRIQLSIQLHDNQSDDEIKAEIRTQLGPFLRDFGASQSGEHGTRVLLVEDDPLFVKIVSSVLQASDVHIKKASSAERAVELLREEKFDVLLTDLHMQNMSGVELVDHVLAEHLIDASRILVITGDRHGQLSQWAKSKSVRVLHKPISPGELKATLEEIL